MEGLYTSFVAVAVIYYSEAVAILLCEESYLVHRTLFSIGDYFSHLQLCLRGVERLHNEELHSLYRSPNIVRVIKSRRLR